MIVVDVAEGYVLIFCANHNSPPTSGAGKVDWSRVTRVQILDVRRDDV